MALGRNWFSAVMAAGIPCVLVTSCSSNFSSDRLVQHILGAEDAVVEVTANDAVRFYPWTIDNKYYSADINLCVVPNKFLVTAEIAESVQAFVVYFDSTQVRFCSPWTLNKKLFCAFSFPFAFSVSSFNVSFSVFVCMFFIPLEIWS